MKSKDPDCDFCRIVAGLETARVVCRTEDALAFFPLHPVIRGHTLVIPKRHVSDLWSADPVLVAEVMDAVLKTGAAIRSTLRPDGLNVINSTGEAASQTVFHLHVHLVPRWQGDHIGDIWPPSPFIPGEVLDETAEEIRAGCL